MRRWLLKSEPGKYGWPRFVEEGGTHWDGVRNHQASNNLRAMRKGDHAFFYHSNEGLSIVGIAEITREAYPDPGDASGRFVMVDIAPVREVPKPVSLAAIKAEPKLKDFALVRQSRLSVVPVSEDEWRVLCDMSGVPDER